MRVLWAQTARAELEEIAAWSWREHPDTTERFLVALLNHVELLERFPAMGIPVKSLEPGMRRMSHTPFYIYYRLDPVRESVEIVHIWHQARKPPNP